MTEPIPIDGPDTAKINAETVLDAPDGLEGDAEGQTLGKFALKRKLGRGGMGVVYLAADPDRGDIALKLLDGERFGGGEAKKAARKVELVKRFEREARAAMALRHPAIVRVYELGKTRGRYYLSMEYVQGRPLDEVISSNPLDPRQAAEWALTLADGLGHAHSRGILHRDLKPENILITNEGAPKVVDFGLARIADGSTLTVTGQVIGTPAYMSPEQVSGDPTRVGPPSDVYGLGAVLYEMITGHPPFEGQALVDVIFKVVSEEPRKPTELVPDMDPGLEAIALRCLAKSPKQRYANGAVLAKMLQRWLDGEAITAPPEPAPPPQEGAVSRFTGAIGRRIKGMLGAGERKRARSLLYEAEAAARAGEFDRARSLFEAAIQAAPDDWSARAKLAELLLDANQRSEAAVYFFQAFEAANKSQDKALMAFRAVDLLRELGKRKMARKILERARAPLAGTRYESYLTERLDNL